jgi:hypothetical protein
LQRVLIYDVTKNPRGRAKPFPALAIVSLSADAETAERDKKVFSIR